MFMDRRFLPFALALGLACILPCRQQAVRAAVDSKETIAHRAWQGIPGLERTAKGRVFSSWFTGGP
jgi:hypothetical protein